MPALCSPPLYRLVVLDIFYNSSPLLEALVVRTEEASKDCGRQHVPQDLHVVCSHLLVSSLLLGGLPDGPLLLCVLLGTIVERVR
jgi:hypothetical protein